MPYGCILCDCVFIWHSKIPWPVPNAKAIAIAIATVNDGRDEWAAIRIVVYIRFITQPPVIMARGVLFIGFHFQ